MRHFCRICFNPSTAQMARGLRLPRCWAERMPTAVRSSRWPWPWAIGENDLQDSGMPTTQGGYCAAQWTQLMDGTSQSGNGRAGRSTIWVRQPDLRSVPRWAKSDVPGNSGREHQI